MATFKDRFNLALELRDISPAELSRRAGVNEGAISQYRSGAYKASQRNLEKLAVALRVSIPWLMGADVPMCDDDTLPPTATCTPAPPSVSTVPIYERIKQRRKELGLSADDVAAALGVSRATIYRYESAEIEKVPITALVPLAKVLRTTPVNLMGWDDNSEEISSEAQKIAKAFDKATPKDKSTVRLVLSEYLDDEVIELANVARTGVNITVTETLGEHEARRAATLHDIETLEDTKLP